jgi:hypothetical protein
MRKQSGESAMSHHGTATKRELGQHLENQMQLLLCHTGLKPPEGGERR